MNYLLNSYLSFLQEIDKKDLISSREFSSKENKGGNRYRRDYKSQRRILKSINKGKFNTKKQLRKSR